MPREMRDGRFVDPATCVDIYCVDDLKGWLRCGVSLMLGLELTGGREQQAAIRREGEAPEEGRQGFVSIEVGILDT